MLTAEPVGFQKAAHPAPHCDNTLMKIVEGGTRMWMDFGGMRTLGIAL